MSKLPGGWALASVGQIIEGMQYGSSAKTNDDASGVPVLRMGNIQAGKLDFRLLKYLPQDHSEFPELLLSPGDLIFNRTNSPELVGKSAVYRGSPARCSCASYLIRVRLYPDCAPDYLAYYLNSMHGKRWVASVVVQQVGQANVNGAKLKALDLPLPPAAEQRRIVAKVEELFSELDEGVANLKKARAQLAVYRQALLKHAFEGHLTTAWRTTHASELETADQLLARIRAEREARYRKQLKEWMMAMEKWEAGNREESKPSKTRTPTLAKLPSEDQLALLPILPTGWNWMQLGSCNVDVFDGPFGSHLKTSDYVASGIRVVRLENIGVLKFIEEKESFVTPAKYEMLSEHTVVPGDIVFSSFITERVRVALVPPSIDKAVNKADCFCVRCHGTVLNNRFTCVLLSTRSAYKQLEAAVHGVGRPRINTTQLKELFVPVCSTAEQRELMNEVEAQFSEVDALEADIDLNLQKSEALRQSILKKAFAGELVPQDPADEPAAALLARIRAEREAAGAVAKAEKPRKAKTKNR